MRQHHHDHHHHHSPDDPREGFRGERRYRPEDGDPRGRRGGADVAAGAPAAAVRTADPETGPLPAVEAVRPINGGPGRP